MDPLVAERLSALAEKTDAFGKLEPENLSQREVTAAQMAAVVGLVSARPDVQVTGLAKPLQPKVARLKWPQVFEFCDSDKGEYPLLLSNPDSVVAVVTFLAALTPDAVKAFLEHRWTRLDIQIALASSIVASSPKKLKFDDLGIEPILDSALLPSSMALNYVPVVHLILDAVCREPPSEVAAKALLDTQVKTNPALILVGGVTMPEPLPPVLESILSSLFALYFTEDRDISTSPIISKLAQANPAFVYTACLHVYTRDPAQLDRIALTANSLGLLSKWCEQIPNTGYTFMLELIAAASRLDIISAKEFLASKFITGGRDAVTSLLDFLQMKITAAAAVAAGKSPAVSNLLSLRTVAAFLTLTSSIDVPPDRMEQLKSIQFQCLQTYPRLINFGQGYDDAILANKDLPTFPPDVEQEMKVWFQKMYAQQIEIRDVISMLERLKASDNPRDQDLFACMTHSLFDEYRFFPEYPLAALATTAVLFGSLIRFRLVDDIPLSIALRFVLESLRQPVETGMFRFGLQALFQLNSRLPEFPKYCSVLLTIPGLASQHQFYQSIKDIVFPASSLEVVAQQNAFKALNADTGEAAGSIEQPSEKLKDKVLFVINNLSPNNVAAKSKELVGFLDQRYNGWLAEYIISERALSEPNYHGLYIALLSSINSTNLITLCCHFMYLHMIRIVNDPDALSNSKRTELKNLGAFLGSLTLKENKPILYDNINFKLLLAESIYLEKLPAVLPFVCKILETCSESTIFSPPNAWTMGLLAVLSELYQFGDLKLNLKFEIEVLCNALGLKINDIEPLCFIRNNEAIQLEQEMMQLHLEDIVTQPAIHSNGVFAFGPTATGGSEMPAPPLTSIPVVPEQAPAGIQLVGETEFVTHPALRRLFELAISKTIQEILLPMIERSVSIASCTTKELVTKDFALEPSEQKLQAASHNLASTLAVSMSLVTAKDPFAEALVSNLHSLLLANGYGEHNMILDQVPTAARDNIEIIIPFVESTARQRALVEVDESLAPNYAARQRYYQSSATGGDNTFMDSEYSNYSSQLPDPLALRPGGLSEQQLAVYDDFSVISDVPGMAAEAPASGTPHAILEQAIQQTKNCIETLERLIADAPEKSFSELKPDSRVLGLLSQLLSVATRSAVRDEVILKTAQVTVSAMFSAKTQFGREVMCHLLSRLCELSTVTAKEVVCWLIYSEDERKYNVPVMTTLMRAKLISATEIDVNLAKEMREGNTTPVEFACGLILESVLGPQPFCLRSEFAGSLDALDVLSRAESPSVIAKSLLTSLHDAAGEMLKSNSQPPAGIPDAIKDEMAHLFAEWICLVQHPCCTERLLHIFVHELANKSVLSNSEPLYCLIRTAMSTSLENYANGLRGSVEAGELFVGTDALAKLIVSILGTTEDMPTDARLKLARGMLSVITLMLAGDHEKEGAQFDGRPYFRFWSTLLVEINRSLEGEGNFKKELLVVLGNIFLSLQPSVFPAFTSSWMTLISHRHFMYSLLSYQGKGWTTIYTLLEALILFLVGYSQGTELNEPMSLVYKGTMRILLVILHDFPTFFVVNYWEFCNIIPSGFVQLLNLVLSAIPPEIEVTNPLSAADTSQLDFSVMPLKQTADIATFLAKIGTRKFLDQAVQRGNSAPQQVFTSLIQTLALPHRKHTIAVDTNSVGVSVPGYNALAIFLAGSSANKDGRHYDEDNAQAQVCVRILSMLNAEARYVFISAMVNQLRYPNFFTFFYSKLLLSLFGSFGAQNLREHVADVRHIIGRVLLERIVSNRPHPWGLMSTFSQLLTGKQYKFWEMPFVKAYPEIEQMFSSLFNHINPQIVV